MANTLGNLGAAYQSLGQYQEAIAHLQEQLAIAQEIGDILALANAFGNLGLFSTLCDNFCLWNREMLIGQDF